MIKGIEKYYKPGIEVKRNNPTPNGIGGWVDSYELHLEIVGRIRPLSGSELEIADKLTVRSTHRLYCAVCDIKEADRVYYDGRIYNVQIVMNMMDMDNHLQIDMMVIE